MKRILVSILFGILILIILTSCCKHEYSEATCTEDGICNKCDKIIEKAYGHQEVIYPAKERTCTSDGLTEGSYCSVCNLTLKKQKTIPALGHTGGTATCTQKAICENCKNEYGAVKGHNYTQKIMDDSYLCSEATCTQAETYYYSCVCGKKGNETFKTYDALGHTGGAATCSQKAVCDNCNQEYGDTLEHTFGEWEIKTQATVSVSGTMIQNCNVCDYSKTKSYKLDSFVKNNKFIFTVDEFRNMFFKKFDYLSSEFGGAMNKTKDGQAMIDIRDSSFKNVGNIGFVVDKNSWTMASYKTDSCFDGMVMILSSNEKFVANAMISFVVACFPSITDDEARAVCRDITSGSTTHKGVNFTLNITENYYMLTAVVSQ